MNTAPTCFLRPHAIPLQNTPIRTPQVSPARPTWRCAAPTVTGAALKTQLLERVAPLEGGMAIIKDPAAQKSIDEFIQTVERENPSKAPTRDKNLVGAWRLVYTTSRTILGANRPKPFRPTKLLQFVSPFSDQILNVEYVEPFGPGGVSWTNRIRVALSVGSDSRVDVQFMKFELFGPRLKYDTSQNTKFKGFLDITYLDQDMRISRGSEDNVFVLVRDDDRMENYM